MLLPIVACVLLYVTCRTAQLGRSFPGRQVCGMLMRPLVYKKPNEKQKPLLQKMAEDKQRQLKRGSNVSDNYFFVKLPDGTLERRPKWKLNADPGVHSSLALNEFGSPSGALPTITEAARTGGSSSPEDTATAAPAVMLSVSAPANGSCMPNLGDKDKDEAGDGEQGAGDDGGDGDGDGGDQKEDGDGQKENGDGQKEESGDGEKQSDSADQKTDDSKSATKTSNSSVSKIRTKEGDNDSEKASDEEKNDVVPELPSEDRCEMGRRGSKKEVRVRAAKRRSSVPKGEPAQPANGAAMPKNVSTPAFDHKRRGSGVRAAGLRLSSSGNSLNPDLRRLSFHNRRGTGPTSQEDLWLCSNTSVSIGSGSRSSLPRPGEMLRPMSRRDIFYSGSIAHLAQYQSQRSLASYRASVLSLPRDGYQEEQHDPSEYRRNHLMGTGSRHSWFVSIFSEEVC